MKPEKLSQGEDSALSSSSTPDHSANPKVDDGVAREVDNSQEYETAKVVRAVGKGAFGTVFKAMTASDQCVAIKRVYQDPKYQNRELEIWKMASKHNHPNVMNLRHHFFVNEEHKIFLHLVMDYFPIDLGRLIERYAQSGRRLSTAYTKRYMYQLARGLHFLHSCGVAHRDLKPPNIMVDPEKDIVRICDMGSAKVIQSGQPSLAYICSRFYRAPELLFGSTRYGTQVDMWSFGCVFAEVMLGAPLFRGESSSDQLVEIVSLRGTPCADEVRVMNDAASFQFNNFRYVKPVPFTRVFGKSAQPDAMDLLDATLQYSPEKRLRPAQAMSHPFFGTLSKDAATTERPGPELFDFSELELGSPDGELLRQLVCHAQAALATDPSTAACRV